MNRTLSIVSVAVCIGITACSKSLSGTYEPQGEDIVLTAPYKTFTFNSNKVEVAMLASTMEAEYTVEDQKVKLTAAGQTLVFPLDEHGCLNTPSGGKFCKK